MSPFLAILLTLFPYRPLLLSRSSPTKATSATSVSPSAFFLPLVQKIS